jgi:predicted phage terminase large subunit-like protein
MNEQTAYNQILRTDFPAFLHRCMRHLNPGSVFMPNWHLDAIAYRLQRVRDGEVTRLIINLPPRYLKSLTVSVAASAFMLGHDPHKRIIGISYGTDLSAKHAADFRTIVESDWYKRVFPGMRISRATDSIVETTLGGFRKATSISAALTGFGGDCFIIDDPQKPVDAQSETQRNQLNQWFSNTLVSRLDNKNTGIIIVVMQRVHLNDLTGYLTENSDAWDILSLPAIAEVDEQIPVGDREYHVRLAGEVLHPEYESLVTLEQLRTEMGSETFSAQYQQSPVPPGGAMIRKEWFRYFDVEPERTHRTKVIQSWDTAAKDGVRNDWSVCTTWLVLNKRDYYLLDVTRGRYEYPQLRDMAVALAEKYKPTLILVEDASTGTALTQELRQAGRHRVKAIPVERNKVERMFIETAKFEAGFVHFRRNARYLAELETELLSFPQGKHDDQVDSFSQALANKSLGFDASYEWVG